MDNKTTEETRRFVERVNTNGLSMRWGIVVRDRSTQEIVHIQEQDKEFDGYALHLGGNRVEYRMLDGTEDVHEC